MEARASNVHACLTHIADHYHVQPALIERVIRTVRITRSGIGPMGIPSQWMPVLVASGFSAKRVRDSYCWNIAAGAWILADDHMTASPFRAGSPLPHISARFVVLADQAGSFYHVSPALILAVAAQESGFNPQAVSSAGAKGLMQLMPATAREMGVSNPFNPRQSIWGGTRYLAQLIRHYRGKVRLALAAYNAGVTAVDSADGRIPAIPETRSYVPGVIGKYLAIINSSGDTHGS